MLSTYWKKLNSRQRLSRNFLCLLLWGIAVPVYPEPQVSVQVSKQDALYVARSEIIIALSPQQVRTKLTQYTRLPELNPGIKSVQVLPFNTAGRLRLRVKAAACVLFFCRSYSWNQMVYEQADGSIIALIEPDNGAFKRGKTHYQFLPHGLCTRMVFKAELEPEFWIPPLIDIWAFKRKLHQEAVQTAQTLEQVSAAKTIPNCQL